MCGIGAIFSNNKIDNVELILDEINKTQHHRGPDGNGTWYNEEKTIGFAHTRLSIIDLTEGSAQPLISHDDRFVMTFNGEIYNYIELREECKKLGSKFKTEGDGEVILECYRHFGEKLNEKLRGMWSFILFDKQESRVHVSRDPFGIKPLFFGEKDGKVIFASEIKSFHKLDNSFIEVDDISVEIFKKHKVHDRGNWTFYQNVKRFPHAHFVEFSMSDNINIQNLIFNRYWEPTKKIIPKDYELLRGGLKDLFENSINLHMRADVPVGFCLSGGVDSSSIVAMARKCNPKAELHTFTTRFSNYARIDETKWAKKVISDVKANPHFIDPDPKEFKEDFQKLVSIQDEPFGTASIYSQYCIFKGISKEGVKVILDGQGADEAFSGYHSFFPFYLKSFLREGKFLSFFKMARLLKKKFNFRFPVTRTIRSLLVEKIKTLIYGKSEKLKLEYLKLGSEDTYEQRMKFINQPIRSFDDLLTFMVCEGNVPQLLRFEDRNSMAFSIESRVPFLVNELVDYSISIPYRHKMKDGITKYILRESMRGIVNDEVLDRQDKLGFPAPDKEWLKEIFNLDVSKPFSNKWVDLILDTWKTVLDERKRSSLDLI